MHAFEGIQRKLYFGYIKDHNITMKKKSRNISRGDRQSSTESYLLVWNTVFYNETGCWVPVCLNTPKAYCQLPIAYCKLQIADDKITK